MRLAFLIFGIMMVTTTHARGEDPKRIVFLGDSITDGHTYPLLIQQALTEVGKTAPTVINAGIGGDTAKGMRARLDRDVLVHKPDLVTFLAGANDVAKGVEVPDYAADVTAIAQRMKDEKIDMIILTTALKGEKHRPSYHEKLYAFDTELRRIAKQFGFRVAEVRQRMTEARDAGTNVLEDDQIHPNFEGQRCIARAVLDALGHADVAVPKELKAELMPGVVTSWKMRAITDPKTPPLDEKSIASLKADDNSWKSYKLPESEPQTTMKWLEQIRRQGYAISVDKIIGPGKLYYGIAELRSDAPRDVYFNTGAQLQAIWLNGKRIYRSDGWTGYHAGKERVPARLNAGVNRIVIETGGQFFLSVTDTNDW